MNVLITGSSGFLGKYLVQELNKSGVVINLVDKNDNPELISDKFKNINIVEHGDYSEILAGMNVVVHLANLAHVDSHVDEEIYLSNNCIATLNFARQAASQGVEKFIYISTANIYRFYNEEYKRINLDLNVDAQTKSKAQAEQELLALAGAANMQVIILRPPLIYGNNVKGNLRKLASIVKRRFPLPLKGVKNVRSFVYAGNVASLIRFLIESDSSDTGVFTLADCEISTAELVSNISMSIESNCFTFFFPHQLISLVLRCLGKLSLADALFESFVVPEDIRLKHMGWQASITSKEGFENSFKEFK
ncbi:MAG: NAD-dependent epimerase/dehydratase family protein [Gammaproteobacteria bacterium]|nr:NAD-dependent epimerase/dehydratase family protein [Gammaproteobacteria bacterium]MBU2058455.1 NAD-dependent epimerase/dehydratase family protein [Gammaproteobacteria bacterium]MBU2176492.1 NAD-dependent epimerase/dehydratase family protein [Gammaproteobacteria bacterium]MBU2248566.1 NAD-dependent epimerase/dehydratase family protein [Gammaproteobacteria bacterium]MBU2345571.1 NAD-dependent epimerase/dehydratase family protein [Gammaproteobacteria bacterium]